MDDIKLDVSAFLGPLKNEAQANNALKNAGQGAQQNPAQNNVEHLGEHANNFPPGHANGHHKPGRKQLEFQSQGQHFQFKLNPHANGNSPFADGGRRGHAYGHGHHEGHGWTQNSYGTNSLTNSVFRYLKGESNGEHLLPTLRHALDAVSDTLGREWVSNLDSKNGERVVRLIEHAIAHANRSVEHAMNHAHDSIGRGSHEGYANEPEAQRLIQNLLSAAQLGKHLDHLEKAGGNNVVREAEAVITGWLFGERNGLGKHVHVSAAELLRDLRSGAFRPATEVFNPFPLTGRARVVSEMMELMRTFDAIERAVRQLDVRHNGAQQGGLDGALKGRLAGGALSAFEELASMLPGLPGRAGRNEIPNLINLLGGTLTDAHGKPLVAADGTLLKLDQLLWLSTAGGLLKGAFTGETFPVRLSPLLIYGFDAVYSVIGFDGRTLNPPHFAAVQAQINGSELEWVFGHAPLTEGWMRALIERLKDSALADHNVLGEMLEEALATGRFHAALVSGSVEEGEAVAGSFKVTRLLPAAQTGDAAFNYA